ncbi:MAG: hypothetical protein ACM3TR_13490 [Caulobacteraceae bacterium]
MERYLADKDDLKHCIISKVDELIECVQKLGKADVFQITVKYKNGEIVTSTDFPDIDSLNQN